MIKKLMHTVALALLLAVPHLAVADQLDSSSSKGLAHEVTFLSVDIGSNGFGSVVAKPCDDYVECSLIYALISNKTEYTLNRHKISLREARKTTWAFGTISVDKNGNAVKVSLIQAGPNT